MRSNLRDTVGSVHDRNSNELVLFWFDEFIIVAGLARKRRVKEKRRVEQPSSWSKMVFASYHYRSREVKGQL